MKHLLPVLCLMVATSVSAQQVAKGITATNGEHIGFWEYKPADYDTDPTKKYPLIIFLHGFGERGNGTTNLGSVLSNGLPKNIAEGHNMRFFWNGKWETFIVLSPQLNSQYTYWQHFYVEDLLRYANQNFRIDTNRVFLTGLSMGGGGTWNYAGATVRNAKRFAALGISCGACQDIPWCNIPNANLPLWAFHANDDNSAAPPSCTTGAINYINSTCNPAVPPIMTIWPNGGHAIWGRVYDPGHAWQNPNLYEWFLGQNKSRPINRRPIANAGPNVTISTATGGVNLSGALSKDLDGTLVRYIWRKVSGPLAGGIVTPVSDHGLTRINGLTTPGTYQFELKAIDDRADWSFAVVNVTVVSGSAPNIPPITEAGPDQAVIYPEADLVGNNSYDPDGTVVSYHWTKVAGPAVFTLSDPDAPNPTVTDLLIGNYEFELETTDNAGAKTTDRVLINATAVVLPVKLLYFKGNRSGESTQLLWATENEDGYERYEVEASQDGQHFETIATVNGADKAAAHRNYAWTDQKGAGYYRLKIIARNNRIRYSAIIRIDQHDPKITLDFFPNPVQHTISILLNNNQKGMMNIRLFGMDGKLAKQQQWVKQQDLIAVTLDTRSLTSGIYLMEVTLGNNWREVRKVVKQ